jgi:S1-C subfamily serine protease
VVNKKGELLGVVRGRFGYAFSPDYIYKDHSVEFFMRSSRTKDKDLCYAVPVSRVVSVAEDLEKFGKVRQGWLGVLLSSRGEDDLPGVSGVTKNSPAEKAGIRKGDRILEIKNKPVRTGKDVARLIKTLKPGEKVKIELLRDNIRKSVIAVIGEAEKNYRWRYTVAPDGGVVAVPEKGESLPMMQNYVFSFSGSRTLGFDVMAITPQLAEKFNVKEGSGLMISKVHKGTAAEKAGFQPADIIVSAGGKKIERNADLRQVLNKLHDDESIPVLIYRGGKKKTLHVVPGKTGNQYFGIFDRFRNKMKDIQIRIDDENRLTRDAELKKYKEEVERMKKQQEALKKELERMRKLIEKKKQESNI